MQFYLWSSLLCGWLLSSPVVPIQFLLVPTRHSQGLGFQNFREWEAIVAGAIPLVDDTPMLQPLWENMPVVRVKVQQPHPIG